MSELTSDPNDPRLGKPLPSGQNEAYLVLSEEERKKGFVRPLRRSYRHATCGEITSMSPAIAETYARNPKFYGATFCIKCGGHFPLAEFKWADSDEVVGS